MCFKSLFEIKYKIYFYNTNYYNLCLYIISSDVCMYKNSECRNTTTTLSLLLFFFVSPLIKNSNYSLNVIRIQKIKNALKFKHKNNFKFKECFI